MEPPAGRHQAPHNLRPEPTSLIGREQALDALTQSLLQAEVRLLTLTGPGGTGKTRLAIAVAERALNHFQHGVYFVDLAPLHDPVSVIPTIAHVLQVPPTQEFGSIPDALVSRLHDKRLLLVLDNFEHLLDAALDISGLLAATSDLKVLVTSRAPLHIRWEHEVPVAPLRTPDLRATSDLPSLSQTPSVALFVERAQAVRPGLQLTDANARSIAQICVRVDGLPLALELAAARSKTLAPADLLGLLERHFDPLTGGPDDAVPRQRTLRSTIEWSHDLLASRERTLFRRLGIFPGGWSLEAAQAICAGDDLEDSAVIDLLERLVDRSLVQMDEVRGHARYHFLETLRQFAREQLAAHDQDDEVGRRHTAYYLGVAEDLATRVYGPLASASVTGAQAELEHDNLHAALRRLIEHRDVEHAMRLANALERIKFVSGSYAEDLRLFEAVLALPGADGPTELRASLLIAAATWMRRGGDLAGAQHSDEQALAIARATHNINLQARALHGAGLDAELQGDFVRAQTLIKRTLELDRREGWRSTEVHHLADLGRIAWKQGDLETARALADEALVIARPLGSADPLMHALLLKGNASRDLGNLDLARDVLEEAVALAGQLRDQRLLAFCLDALGRVALAQGRRHAAQAALAESLRLWWEIGERAKVPDSLEIHARLIAARGQREGALRLAGAAAALRTTVRVAVNSNEETMHQAWLEQTRQAVGGETFEALVSAGRGMTMDQAVAYALQGDASAAQRAIAADAKPVPLNWAPLTAREQEVAKLVASGMANRQIASKLVVTPATAAKHVEHIREKLGLTSRMQIAAWVLERDIETVPPG